MTAIPTGAAILIVHLGFFSDGGHPFADGRATSGFAFLALGLGDRAAP